MVRDTTAGTSTADIGVGRGAESWFITTVMDIAVGTLGVDMWRRDRGLLAMRSDEALPSDKAVPSDRALLSYKVMRRRAVADDPVTAIVAVDGGRVKT